MKYFVFNIQYLGNFFPQSIVLKLHQSDNLDYSSNHVYLYFAEGKSNSLSVSVYSEIKVHSVPKVPTFRKNCPGGDFPAY